MDQHVQEERTTVIDETAGSEVTLAGRTIDMGTLIAQVRGFDFQIDPAGVSALGAGVDLTAPPRPGRYTLTEAASHLGVRSDDLLALLHDSAILEEAPRLLDFTLEEVEILERVVQYVRNYALESVYGGAEL